MKCVTESRAKWGNSIRLSFQLNIQLTESGQKELRTGLWPRKSFWGGNDCHSMEHFIGHCRPIYAISWQRYPCRWQQQLLQLAKIVQC